jgi:hypothetical protein
MAGSARDSSSPEPTQAGGSDVEAPIVGVEVTEILCARCASCRSPLSMGDVEHLTAERSVPLMPSATYAAIRSPSPICDPKKGRRSHVAKGPRLLPPRPGRGHYVIDRESFLEGWGCAREGVASDSRAEAEEAWRLAWGDAPGDLRGAYRLAQKAHMEAVGELANAVSRAEAAEAEVESWRRTARDAWDGAERLAQELEVEIERREIAERVQTGAESAVDEFCSACGADRGEECHSACPARALVAERTRSETLERERDEANAWAASSENPAFDAGWAAGQKRANIDLQARSRELEDALRVIAQPGGACAKGRGACRGGAKASEIARAALSETRPEEDPDGKA